LPEKETAGNTLIRRFYFSQLGGKHVNASDRLIQELYGEIRKLWVIDAHEHLAPESERLQATVDAASAFGWYSTWALEVAGMPESDFLIWNDLELPVEQRWRILNKYLPLIRNTSFARSVFLGVRELYGFDDITDDNYQEVSEAMAAANKPGIYCRALRDCGHIAAALTQAYDSEIPARGSFRIPQLWLRDFSVAYGTGPIERIETELKQTVSSLDDYVEALPQLVAHYKRQGVVGIKVRHQPTPLSAPSRSEVTPLFERILQLRQEPIQRGVSPLAVKRPGLPRPRIVAPIAYQEVPLTEAERTLLLDFTAHIVFQAAGELQLPISYHVGYNGPWRDFRVLNADAMIPVFQQYQQVRFELYHAGTIWERELGLIAATFPNVWLNQCFALSLSQQMAKNALDGWLDMLPANKIIAWGGDAYTHVEGLLGDLILACESLAEVLAHRLRGGRLRESQAIELAKMMLYDNPKNLYGLKWEAPGNLRYE
jgi:predicted TIM-barrel fold metal-dependent hydrolase